MEHLKNWLNTLFESMQEYKDEDLNEYIFNNLGRNCYKNSDMIKVSGKLNNKLKDNKDIDYIVQFLSNEMDDFTFCKIEDGFTVNLNNKKCFCPIVNQRYLKNELMCNCTKGFDKAMYEEILGREVNIEVIDSLLRNGGSCIFKVKIV